MMSTGFDPILFPNIKKRNKSTVIFAILLFVLHYALQNGIVLESEENTKDNENMRQNSKGLSGCMSIKKDKK